MIGQRSFFGVLFLALVSLDQLAKTTMPVRWINPGIAFSMFPGAGLSLGFLSVVVLALLTWTWRGRAAFYFPLILLWAGLLSNLYDRIAKGAVVDIFHLGPLMFNLADVWILSALTLFVLRRKATDPS
jgi:lipoprotein signal peptidase